VGGPAVGSRRGKTVTVDTETLQMKSGLIPDNGWHHAFLYRLLDGSFKIVKTPDEAIGDPEPKEQEGDNVVVQEIMYNWNHGQPRIFVGGMKGGISTLIDGDGRGNYTFRTEGS
jgi:hypothetical protein